MNRARMVLRDVCKQFKTPGGSMLPAVEGVSLTVNDGEFISIIGPSGCGKTTLLNMIAGFEQATSGSITLDGKPVTGPGAERGVIFQEYGIFPWLSVRENIAFGLSLRASRVPAVEHEEIVRRYVDLMGLRGFETAYPKTLSGGMKQRVALARLFALDPDILLMDEPFGALDSQTRELLQEELQSIWRRTRKTALFVTHDIDEAIYLATRVIVFTARPGRIKADIRIPTLDRSGDYRKSEEYLTLRVQIWDLLRDEVLKARALEEA
jgi:NitT/TauT family transport system ATP-binding protein